MCTVFVHAHSPNQSKLDARATKRILIGCSSNKKGYKCYCPITKNIFNSMDVTFFEDQSYYSNFVIQGKKNGQELQNWDWVSLIEPISESSRSPTHIILPEPTITLLNSFYHKDTPETPEKSVFIEHNIAEHELMSPKPNLVSLESAPRKESQVYSRRKKQLGRSEFCPVQTQQSQESNLSPAALEQAQEKAETDVDSLV